MKPLLLCFSISLSLCLFAAHEAFEYEQDKFANFIHEFSEFDDITRQNEIITDLIEERKDYLKEHPDAKVGILLRGLSPKLMGQIFDYQKPEMMGFYCGSPQYFLRYDSVAPMLHFEKRVAYVAAGHVVVLIRHQSMDYLLLIKDRHKDTWWLPGGTLNHGEFSLVDAALRELYEETTDSSTKGIHLNRLDLVLGKTIVGQSHLFGLEVADINHVFYHSIIQEELNKYPSLTRLFNNPAEAGGFAIELANNDEITHLAAMPITVEHPLRTNLAGISIPLELFAATSSISVKGIEKSDAFFDATLRKLSRHSDAHISREKMWPYQLLHGAAFMLGATLIPSHNSPPPALAWGSKLILWTMGLNQILPIAARIIQSAYPSEQPH